MLLFLSAPDVLAVYTQRTVQNDLVFVGNTIITLPSIRQIIPNMLSDNTNPLENDTTNEAHKQSPYVCDDVEKQGVLKKHVLCNVNTIESPSNVIFVLNPTKQNTAKAISRKVADSSDFGDIDAWYEANSKSMTAFEKIDEECDDDDEG